MKKEGDRKEEKNIKKKRSTNNQRGQKLIGDVK
jgi:hypothetical protein